MSLDRPASIKWQREQQATGTQLFKYPLFSGFVNTIHKISTVSIFSSLLKSVDYRTYHEHIQASRVMMVKKVFPKYTQNVAT